MIISQKPFQMFAGGRYLLIWASLVLVLALSFPQGSLAATFTVTKTADTNDGTCDADCSLREAIGAANALPGTDIVTIPAGIYTLSIAGAGENLNATGDLDVTDDVSLSGAGSSLTVIDGGGIDRVLEIRPGAIVLIDAVTVRKGAPGASGGGIFNRDTLTITNSVITDNTGLDFGGGIYSFGAMTLTDTTVSDNETVGLSLSGGGGGIFNEGTMVLTGTTVSNNTTLGRGGGIYNLDLTLTSKNSTISGNTALNGGGIFNRFGTVGLTHNTLANNTATDNGGGIWNFGGAMTLTNTILSANTAATPADNCAGAITSVGHNIASDATCVLAGVGDLNSTDPMLGPLADNSGPTETHSLLVGSPALDNVPLAFCPFAIDQRGAPRPQGPACDTGAVEDDGDGIYFFDDLCPFEAEDFDGVNDADGCPEGSTACTGPFASVIVGTAAPNLLIGTAGPDHIIGNGGADRVFGLGGDDCIETGSGADYIEGGEGNDEILAGSGSNRVLGGLGRDTVVTGAGSDRVEAGAGNDEVYAGGGGNRVLGGSGDDFLTTGAGADLVNGEAGIDTCVPGGGANTVISCEL